MTVFIYVNTSKQVGDPNTTEDVAFECEVICPHVGSSLDQYKGTIFTAPILELH